MRFCYLDTAGTSKPSENPFVVCAGIIVDADRQWKSVEKYLADMADECVPPEKRTGFCFHAMDLFHGSGEVFHRDAWAREQRWSVLRELCEMPHKFDLPVVVGVVKRADMLASYPDRNPAEVLFACQAMAFQQCALAVERYMRDECPHEVATLVHEVDTNTSGIIKELHNFMKTPESGAIWGGVEMVSDLLPFRNIVDGAHFAQKGETSLLQIADACAFAVNRKLMAKPDAPYFFDPFNWYLVLRHNSFGMRPPEPEGRVKWPRPVPASLLMHAALSFRFLSARVSRARQVLKRLFQRSR